MQFTRHGHKRVLMGQVSKQAQPVEREALMKEYEYGPPVGPIPYLLFAICVGSIVCYLCGKKG